MAYDDYKEGCSVIKEYVDNLNKETAGKIPTKVSELTNDSNYATESYVNTAIGNIAQPTSLPQTYKKKAVTLATSGWIGRNSVVYDFLNGRNLVNNPIRLPQPLQEGDVVTIYTPVSGIKQVVTIPANLTEPLTYTLTVGYYSSGSSIKNKIVVCGNYNNDADAVLFNSAIIGTTKEYKNSNVRFKVEVKYNQSMIGYDYALTDADVKVNSEVRFTLDEANGKLAGQFGLKKTIDKEAGKLTFTADTLPTSAISGTLEIGETSTEGAAFVDGITSDSTPSSLPQTYKKKAVTLATSGWTADSNLSIDTSVRFGSSAQTMAKIANGDFSELLPITEEKAAKWRATYKWGYVGSEKTRENVTGAMFASLSDRVSFSWGSSGGLMIIIKTDGLYAYGYNDGGNVLTLSAGVTKNVQSYTDADVKVNSEIRFTLDEANGKIAGQFGVKKTIDKEAGKLTFTADTLPTSAISGTLEIGETSTEGAAFVEGITSDTTGFVKATEENTFTKTQTFNGTESQAGIKTNAIDNENGNSVVYFNGTKQMFGSGAIPTQVRSSEQRLKLERPVSGGTGTEIVEVANVSDIGTGGVVIKRKNFTARVSDGTLLLDNKANIVLTESKNWTTVERIRTTNKKFISPFSFGLDLQVGEGYTLKVGESTYTAICGFSTVNYVATGETDLVTFGTGAQAKMLEFTIGEKKLRIVDCAVPYGYDEITSPDVTYDGGQVKEAVAAMAFWDDLSSTAISGELTLKTSTYGDVRITDADITSESFVWFETEGTYAYASSGSANFYYAVDVNAAQIKTVTYVIITGMGAGAACEQQTLPKVVNVCIAPSGWTENKIDSPTQGSIPSTSYYSKPNLVYKDTAGAVAASNAGIEVYQTQACPTKFGIKRTSENSTIWAAVKLD